MVLVGMLIGWLLRKVSALSVFSSRLAGLAVLLFAAPAIYSFNSGSPFVDAFIVYGLGALIAAAVFRFMKTRERA
ncbi:hypothetical protein IB267_01450 [Ensifer sp. ENS09]|uniref:hypothetical protein n=1 Tax=Ensifer sp. ENS09 TaxID=2769263 RepID=UPI0017876B56|nr:hypothetical protein [Ensifer sp. ENS09]MBD9647013.1 hypothetical protein [Ensifer sp. ENS09]